MSYLHAYFLHDTEIGYYVWGFGYIFFLVLNIVSTKMTLKYPPSTKAVHLPFAVITFMLTIMVFYLSQVAVYLI